MNILQNRNEIIANSNTRCVDYNRLRPSRPSARRRPAISRRTGCALPGLVLWLRHS